MYGSDCLLWRLLDNINTKYFTNKPDIDGLVQERHNSIANELCLSCINPSVCVFYSLISSFMWLVFILADIPTFCRHHKVDFIASVCHHATHLNFSVLNGGSKLEVQMWAELHITHALGWTTKCARNSTLTNVLKCRQCVRFRTDHNFLQDIFM